MTILLVLISIVLTAICVRARGVFWPGSILAITSLIHLIYFWITGVLGFVPSSVAHWWHYKQPIVANSPYVIAIYTVQCAIGCIAISVGRSKRSTNTATVDSNPDTGLSRLLNLCLIAAAAIFIAVSALHAVSVDWGYLCNYSEYLSARDPDAVNLRFPPLRIFHRIAAQGAFVLLACLFLLEKRQPVTVALVAICAAYGFILSVSYLSRFSTIFPLLLALQAIDTKNIVLKTCMIVGGVSVGFICYMNIISMRLGADLRDERLMGDFGLEPFASSVSGFRFINGETVSASLMSISASGFQLSHAIDHIGSYKIPTIQKFRCFSPLPSAIDKYAENYENSYYAQPQKSGPYSAVGESLVFGYPWLAVVFSMLLASTIFASDIVAAVRTRKSATIVTILFTAAILFFQTYPIRSGIRLFWLILVIWLVLKVPNWLRRRE